MGIKSIKSIDKILTMRATWSRRDVLDFLTEIIDGGVIPHGRFRDSSDGNMVPRRRFRDSSDSSRRMYTRRRYRDSVKGDGNEPPFTYYHRNTRHSVFHDLLDALTTSAKKMKALTAEIQSLEEEGAELCKAMNMTEEQMKDEIKRFMAFERYGEILAEIGIAEKKLHQAKEEMAK